LRDRLQAAATRGHVALVAGEAGIGKTSVLRALAESHDAVWWGACDALQTPHPLAPLLDIARDTGRALPRNWTGRGRRCSRPCSTNCAWRPRRCWW
jgi:predicted ATPase